MTASIIDLLGLGLLGIVGVWLALLILPTSLLALVALAVIGAAALALADDSGDRDEPYRAVDRAAADTRGMDARGEALGELREDGAIDGPLTDMEPAEERVDDDAVEAELDTLKASSDAE